jgi:hypothetical protein
MMPSPSRSRRTVNPVPIIAGAALLILIIHVLLSSEVFDQWSATPLFIFWETILKKGVVSSGGQPQSLTVTAPASAAAAAPAVAAKEEEEEEEEEEESVRRALLARGLWQMRRSRSHSSRSTSNSHRWGGSKAFSFSRFDDKTVRAAPPLDRTRLRVKELAETFARSVLSPWVPFGVTRATVAATAARVSCNGRLHLRVANGTLRRTEDCGKHMYAGMYYDRVSRALEASGLLTATAAAAAATATAATHALRDFELVVSLGDAPEVPWNRNGNGNRHGDKGRGGGPVTPLTAAPLFGADSDFKHMLTVPFVWQDPRHSSV